MTSRLAWPTFGAKNFCVRVEGYEMFVWDVFCADCISNLRIERFHTQYFGAAIMIELSLDSAFEFLVYFIPNYIVQ